MHLLDFCDSFVFLGTRKHASVLNMVMTFTVKVKAQASRFILRLNLLESHWKMTQPFNLFSKTEKNPP